MNIKQATSRQPFVMILTATLLIALLAAAVTPATVSAVFDSETVEEAKRNFPDSPAPQSPGTPPSASQSPSVSKTPITTDENKMKDSDQADDKQSTTDMTPWLVGGGLLLATMLTGAILLSKKKK